MARIGFQSVDEYVAKQPQRVQAILQRVRRALRKALPGAEEVISYQIPTLRLGGRNVVYFAAWQEHCSVHPVPHRPGPALAAALAPHRAGKGTLRFPFSSPVPVGLIERIARCLATEAAARAKARPRAKTRP